jgi:hypothetical protein
MSTSSLPAALVYLRWRIWSVNTIVKGLLRMDRLKSLACLLPPTARPGRAPSISRAQGTHFLSGFGYLAQAPVGALPEIEKALVLLAS